MKNVCSDTTLDKTEELVQLSFFNNIGKSIASSNNLKETIDQVMEHVGNIFAPYNWSLLLRNHNTGDLKFYSVVGEASESLSGQIVKKGQGIVGWIAENGQPIIIEDVTKDKRFDSSFDSMSGFQTKSIIGVPLKSGGKVFGVIELINKLDGTLFTALDLKLLTTIADFAAIAVEKVYYLSRLKKMINIDPLTGIYNRRFLQFYLQKELQRNKRDNTVLSILFIDIDEFKKINDTHGHLTGDDVLKEVASVVNDSIRSSDLLFRFGGDEFIVLLPKTEISSGEMIKKRIISSMEKKEMKVPYSVTIGIFEAADEPLQVVLSRVDEDMYLNKKINTAEIDLVQNFMEEITNEN
jgi:diguanylate cyclase (GGDEF)-like protein